MKKKKVYRVTKSRGLFECQMTNEALSNLDNPLERLSELVDFEMFREELEKVLVKAEGKTPAGRPQIDVVMMFKVLVLQRYYNLSDRQTQYQITDRQSFRDFVGIHNVDDVPDEKTIWSQRDKLCKAGAFDRLFDVFRQHLDSKGLSFQEGRIVDASFVEAPRSRNTREENARIKAGEGASLWRDNPHKKCHKDTDARWTKKRDEVHFGYKVHVMVDSKSKLIQTHATTSASVHDSQVITQLLREADRGQDLHADSAYEGREDVIKQVGMNPVICEKGHRGHPLTEEQKRRNREKSRVRCRVEHVFGCIEGSMGGSVLRCVGMARAKAHSALTCLVYNLLRYGQICRLQPQLITA